MSKNGFTGFEKYNMITENAGAHLKCGESFALRFDGSDILCAERLFFTGEVGIFYMWKSEPDYQELYRRIDDSLSTEAAERDRYALDMSSDFCAFPKVAYKKLTAPLLVSYLPLVGATDEWKIGIFAKAKELTVQGYLRMLVEVRYKRDGVDNHSVKYDADEVFCIDIPGGSYPLRELTKDISFDYKNLASISFYVEGEDYSGEVYLESPYFTAASGYNLLPPFSPHTLDRSNYNWVGQNLSKVERPSLKISINGITVHDGEIFERCHRRSECEIALPGGIIKDGENEIVFTCTSDFREAPPYDLCEIGFITASPDKVVAVPEIVKSGIPFSVIVEGKTGEKVAFESEFIKPISELVLKRNGLNAIRLVTDKVGGDIPFTLFGKEYRILRSVIGAADGVITGTGDMIYVGEDKTAFKNYLKWYFSRGIGNLLTIRPTYRWGGARVYDEALWREVADFLDEAGTYYSHMIDARELPGINTNPTVKALQSPHFLGRQTHELDGQYSYWGFQNITENPITEAFHDLAARMYKRYPDSVNPRFDTFNHHYSDGMRSIYRRHDIPKDMRCATDEFKKSLSESRLGAPRHTGPSTLFKYFYEVGYSWLGAELMYSPTELTASALRGARDTVGGSVGAHLAVQWSTSPHDTAERYRRYLLALFVCYIQGIDEINTEEGLWHLEEYYFSHNRFSTACLKHAQMQREFYKFISTHTRTGKFYTPIAFLHGRFDGWRTFGKGGDAWGVKDMPSGEPEAAWDVLTYFYPKSVLDSLYRHGTPKEPQGYYSGTPHGNVDIIPIENGHTEKYRLLIAPGYNYANADDITKLTHYVKDGGTLVIGWPQLSIATEREAVVSYRHSYITPEELPSEPLFISDTKDGAPISVCNNILKGEVVLKTDSGLPLAHLFKIGKGKVYFINAKEYAANTAVDAAYRDVLDIAVKDCLMQESVYAEGDDNIQFTVFNNDDGSKNIYFVATDWHKDLGDGVGKINIGHNTYRVPVPFGTIVKVALKDEVAVYPLCHENEVVEISDGIAKLQGVAKAEFVLLKDGKETKISVDFGVGGTCNIEI